MSDSDPSRKDRSSVNGGSAHVDWWGPVDGPAPAEPERSIARQQTDMASESDAAGKRLRELRKSLNVGSDMGFGICSAPAGSTARVRKEPSGDENSLQDEIAALRARLLAAPDSGRAKGAAAKKTSCDGDSQGSAHGAASNLAFGGQSDGKPTFGSKPSVVASTGHAVGSRTSEDVARLRSELERVAAQKEKLAADVEQRAQHERELEEAMRRTDEKAVELEERIRVSGGRSPSSCTTEDPGGEQKPESYWKDRAEALESELHRKTQRALELHQRVFWLEAQLRKQLQDNDNRVEDIQASLAAIKQKVCGVSVASPAINVSLSDTPRLIA